MIIVAGILLGGYGDILKEKLFGVEDVSEIEGLGPVDLAHETQMKSLQFSAKSYKNKLTDYEGLCESIGIDREVYSCSENIEQYVIDVPLSNGTYFCVDDTGFIGVTNTPHGDSFSCHK